jgi:hypothetical protein
MGSRRKAINSSVLVLSALAARTAWATDLEFDNTASDGQSYVGSYSDPTDPLSTYGTDVNFGSATTGSTSVYQNFFNTYTLNYNIGNGWTPNVAMAYSVAGAQSVGITYTGPASVWPNGAAELQGNGANNPNDDFYFTFTPAPGYAVRINSYDLVNGSYGSISSAGTIYENTIGGQTLVPTFVPANVGSGPGQSVTVDLQDDYGSTFFTGTLILDVHMTNGNPGDLGLSNLNFDQELVAGPGAWGNFGSGDWNNANNWGGGVVPNGVGASATFGSAISSAETVYTNSPVTVGSMTFDNANEYLIGGSGPLTLQNNSGSATVNVQEGTHEIDLPTIVASNTVFDVTSGASLIVGNPVTINSGSTLTSTGGGAVTYQSKITVQNSASIAFSNSTHAYELSVASGGNASITSPNGGVIVEVDNLANSGTVDIANNEMIVNYGSGSDPVQSIRQEILSGYNNGGWNGTGIISSVAQTPTNGLRYGVGWADSKDNVVSGLSSGQIEIKYTLLGDANLDGTVNGSDFSILAANFGLGHTNWDQGDFLFASSVNGSDFSALAANFGQGDNYAAGTTAADWAALDAFAAANGLPLPTPAAVPEPASMGMLALGVVGLIGRRRRRVIA